MLLGPERAVGADGDQPVGSVERVMEGEVVGGGGAAWGVGAVGPGRVVGHVLIVGGRCGGIHPIRIDIHDNLTEMRFSYSDPDPNTTRLKIVVKTIVVP